MKPYKFNVNKSKEFAMKLQNNLDDLYKSTYYSDNSNSKSINAIRDKMSNILNGLLDKTKTTTGGENISALLSKMYPNDDVSMTKEISSTLQDQALYNDIMDIYSQNIVTRDQDREIDMVCKYMPKLDEALSMKADMVLSADHFEQDALKLTVVSDSNPNNASSRLKDSNELSQFKTKYNLMEFTRSNFEKTDKYGENYIYIVSYSDALSRLLNKNGKGIITESVEYSENTTPIYLSESDISSIVSDNTEEMMISIDENYNLLESSNDYDGYINNNKKEDLFKIEIDKTGIISSIIKEQSKAMRIIKETSSVFNEKSVLGNNYSLAKDSSFLKDIDRNYKKYLEKSLDPQGRLKSDFSSPYDGFTDLNKVKKEKINVPGAVMEVLDHSLIRPLFLRNMCVGYYYFETDIPLDVQAQTTFTSTLGGLRPKRNSVDREDANRQQTDNTALMKLARTISKKIDAKFINSNQDLSKEIYTILKFNADHDNGRISKVRVTFIPPEDIQPSILKMNDRNHRGISGLSRSLFPAKLYSCLYISGSIGLLTRGFDKRIYHVKQTVDTNIHATLLNIINQLKQSNMNIRQIENMNSILNITGRFNDIIVPQNANGESPVTFEVMPGQNIEVKTDFMRGLEEVAVNLTGIPLSQIDSMQQDSTATHTILMNTRTLIQILNIQNQYEKILSRIFTKLYQYEYNTTDTIEVKLPPPMMSKFSNLTQIMASGNEVIQNIVMMKTAGLDQGIKDAFQAKVMEYYFGSWIPMDKINRLLDEAKQEIELNGPSNGGSDTGGSGMY